MIAAVCAVACALILLGLASLLVPGWWRREPARRDFTPGPTLADQMDELNRAAAELRAELGRQLLPAVQAVAVQVDEIARRLFGTGRD